MAINNPYLLDQLGTKPIFSPRQAMDDTGIGSMFDISPEYRLGFDPLFSDAEALVPSQKENEGIIEALNLNMGSPITSNPFSYIPEGEGDQDDGSNTKIGRGNFGLQGIQDLIGAYNQLPNAARYGLAGILSGPAGIATTFARDFLSKKAQEKVQRKIAEMKAKEKAQKEREAQDRINREIRQKDLERMRGGVGRDGGGGGFADNSNASDPGGSDEMGSF